MPRHLPAALRAVAAWPTSDSFARPANDAAYVVADYFSQARHWYVLGVDLPGEARLALLALGKARRDLRRLLDWVVLRYPCAEFQRVYVRVARHGGHADHAAWFAAYPWLKDHLRHDILRLARCQARPPAAVNACLTWARHLGGGEAAWRTLAWHILREDRAAGAERPRNRLRYRLIEDESITRAEAGYLDGVLNGMGGMSLSSWMGSPPEMPRQCTLDDTARAAQRGRWLADAALASELFAGPAWDGCDEGYYARVLAALPADARATFPRWELSLERIADLVAA